MFLSAAVDIRSTFTSIENNLCKLNVSKGLSSVPVPKFHEMTFLMSVGTWV